MNNYLFLTNTENFKIDKNVIDNVNIFLQKEINIDFKLKVLETGSAYEWCLFNDEINIKKISLLIKEKFKNLPVDINLINIASPRKKKTSHC